MHFHHEGYPDCYEHEHDCDTTEDHMRTFHSDETDDHDREYDPQNDRLAYDPELDDPTTYYEDAPDEEPPSYDER